MCIFTFTMQLSLKWSPMSSNCVKLKINTKSGRSRNGTYLFYIIHIIIGVHLMHQSFLKMVLLSISPLVIIIILSSITRIRS